jgi:hypothetical protein
VRGARWRVSSSDSRRRQNHAAEPAPHLPGFLLRSASNIGNEPNSHDAADTCYCHFAAGTGWAVRRGLFGSLIPFRMRASVIICDCHMISPEIDIRQPKSAAARGAPDGAWQAATKAPRPSHAAGVEAVHVGLQRPVQLPVQGGHPSRSGALLAVCHTVSAQSTANRSTVHS